MWGISRSLTDDQIKGLASYFAAQQSVSPGPGNPKLLEKGKQIFDSGLPEQNVPACGACHGDHGQGNGQFPRVANQHADYVIKQLAVYQRTNERPEGAAMKVVTHSLTRDNMQAVAAYLQEIPPMLQRFWTESRPLTARSGEAPASRPNREEFRLSSSASNGRSRRSVRARCRR